MKLQTIKTDNVIVRDRAREDFGNLKELIESFKREGIIQPLAVQQTEEGYILLAGERRLRAAKESKIENIPVRIYEEELSNIEVKSIELAENLYRKDFEWQEQVKLKSDIWEIQQKLHGKKTSTSPNAKGVSKRDVASILGDSPSVFTEDLKLAEFMNDIPILMEQKTKSDAKKMMKKLERDVQTFHAAKEYKEKEGKKSINKKMKGIIDSYIINDFFKGVKKIGDKTIDIVEIDPPYAINLKDLKKQSGAKTGTQEYNEIPMEEYEKFMKKTIKECVRVMKQDSWLLCWFGPDPWFSILWNIIKDEGLEGIGIPAIWFKGTGQTMQPNYYMANSYEMFFYARKGKPELNVKGRPNVFHFMPVPPSRKIHPTERPIEMISEILNVFGRLGSTVMIPFLGSGNTILAANNRKMNGFGFELSETYKNRFIEKVSGMNIIDSFKSYTIPDNLDKKKER